MSLQTLAIVHLIEFTHAYIYLAPGAAIQG